jgi:hypothetical protein
VSGSIREGITNLVAGWLAVLIFAGVSVGIIAAGIKIFVD